MIEANDKSIYIDHATILKYGQFVTVWQLADAMHSKKESVTPSTTTYMEYDCKEEKVRFLDIITYTGNMQSGEYQSILTDPTPWESIAPNTTADFTLDIVCHEWEQIINTDDTKGYLDPATIRKHDQFITIWFLLDFKKQNYEEFYGALSVRTQAEYDCKAAKKRFLLETSHSGSMASGDILTGNTEVTEWEPIKIELDRNLLPIICN